MVSPQTREDVWYTLLDVDRLARYFNRVSVRYGKAGNAVRVALFVVSATGAFTLLNQWPWWVQVIITVALGVVLAVDFWLNPGKTSIVLHSISVEYQRLEDEWRELWSDVNRPGASEDDIRARSRHLKEKMSMVDARVRDSYNGLNDKLNEKCADETYQVMANEFNVKYTS